MNAADHELLFAQFSQNDGDTLPMPDTAQRVFAALQRLRETVTDTTPAEIPGPLLQLFSDADRVHRQIDLILRIANNIPVQEELPGRLRGIANALCSFIARVVDAAGQKS